jgi:hypothetical protein
MTRQMTSLTLLYTTENKVTTYRAFDYLVTANRMKFMANLDVVLYNRLTSPQPLISFCCFLLTFITIIQLKVSFTCWKQIKPDLSGTECWLRCRHRIVTCTEIGQGKELERRQSTANFAKANLEILSIE